MALLCNLYSTHAKLFMTVCLCCTAPVSATASRPAVGRSLSLCGTQAPASKVEGSALWSLHGRCPSCLPHRLA